MTTPDADLPHNLLGQLRPRTTIGHFIREDYHQREHPEVRAPPHHAWVGDGWLPRLPATMDELNLLLLTVAKPRIVHRDGVHFQGLRYVSPLLFAYVREPIIVRYHPRDATEIRVFHKNQVICKAVDPDHETSTLTLKDIQAARSARRRELRGQINQRIAVVARHLPDLASAKTAPAQYPTRAQRWAARAAVKLMGTEATGECSADVSGPALVEFR